jgi:hypothetical protein
MGLIAPGVNFSFFIGNDAAVFRGRYFNAGVKRLHAGIDGLDVSCLLSDTNALHDGNIIFLIGLVQGNQFSAGGIIYNIKYFSSGRRGQFWCAGRFVNICFTRVGSAYFSIISLVTEKKSIKLFTVKGSDFKSLRKNE